MKASETTDLNDAAAFAAARKCLDESSSVPGTVRVHVVDGTVTLTGTVGWQSQRTEAERIIRPAIGGRRVLNNIIVIPDGTPATE
jgi:osmotically-inducible protein OsmY